MATIGHAHIAQSRIKSAGSGLFATKNIEAGELIFTLDRPAVAALDSASLPNVCSNCFVSASGITALYGGSSEDVTLKACTGCKTLRYCSKVW